MKNVSHTRPRKKHPLPHERDQTTEDQQSPVRPEIEQAKDDIESGKKDTDLHGIGGLDRIKK